MRIIENKQKIDISKRTCNYGKKAYFISQQVGPKCESIPFEKPLSPEFISQSTLFFEIFENHKETMFGKKRQVGSPLEKNNVSYMQRCEPSKMKCRRNDSSNFFQYISVALLVPASRLEIFEIFKDLTYLFFLFLVFLSIFLMML